MEKICAYIDLLGFSNYIGKSITDALLLIENYQNIIEDYPNSFRTFTNFLPGSDSIFILGDITNCDEFVKDISEFLIECFLFTASAYSDPIKKEDPTKVITQIVSYSLKEKNVEIKHVQRNWYPTLFKGGLVCGEAGTFTQKSIHAGEFTPRPNLSGNGIVAAVALEKCGRGPRLFCDNTIIDKLSDSIREKYIIGKDNITEILWPVRIFIEETEAVSEIKSKYGELMNPAINLWKSCESTSVGEIYFNFLKLITISASKYAQLKSVEAEFRTFLKEYLQKNKMLHFYESFVNYSRM
jgi:hypothetical protein